tara:strand:+ start:1555 stop:1788 length:234 start_codon:yes stop_codon:yes gene_type:complete
MKNYKIDFYDYEEDGTQIDYSVEFSVTPEDKGDYYQPPSGGEVIDIRLYKNDDLMNADDLDDELESLMMEEINQELR